MCPATSSNPIKSVRQSAQRMRPPDVLTPEEITALLEKLPEPLRTACELDAFTGLRRGELIGLQWQDVDFENLVIHVRRSVVMMVAGHRRPKPLQKTFLSTPLSPNHC
jgi:integrase